MTRWIQKWKVPSSSGEGEYTVSIGENGEWGCSCKHWINRHTDCRHIKEKRSEVGSFYTTVDSGISSSRRPAPSANADSYLRLRARPSPRRPVTPTGAVSRSPLNRTAEEEAVRIISLDDDF